MFQIKFMTLRHPTQCNIAKQGTYKAWSSNEAAGAANNCEQLVTIANGLPKMKSITTKVMASLLCNFLMTQHPRKIFHNTETGHFSLPSMSVRGCMLQI